MDFITAIGLVSNFVLIAGVFSAGYFGFKKWIHRVAHNTGEMKRQLETSDGKTVGNFSEETAHDVDNLKKNVGILVERADQNADRSMEALVLAKHANERLDALLTGLKLQNEITISSTE